MADSAPSVRAQWSVPQCPFTIEYAPGVLDDIRLAVADAFFSLPHGGVEIGGILLGKFASHRLLILGYTALECEHALGPSFTLSDGDHKKLEFLIAQARRHGADLRPVGWYHSHTRSEISLSDADLDIHKRYFPEPWQVALVVKPHTFQPTRAGFFFREADHSIRGTESYLEFVLTPQPIMRAPVVGGEAEPDDFALTPPEPPPVPLQPLGGRASTVQPPPKPVAQAVSEPAAQPVAEAVGAPNFTLLEDRHKRNWRFWCVRLGLAAVIALAGEGFQTRALWLPRLTAAFTPAAPPVSIGLRASDAEGQLHIQWDRNSATVRSGIGAVLEITDGAPPLRSISLDRSHLQAGTFTYGRQSEKVDVALVIDQPNRRKVREVTSFWGKLPERATAPPPEDPAKQAEREALAREAAALKTNLSAQAARTRKLEKSVDDLRRELRRAQQRKRLENQSRDPVR